MLRRKEMSDKVVEFDPFAAKVESGVAIWCLPQEGSGF